MATEGKIVNLESPSSEALFPRTKVKAISDDNNVGLEVLLEEKANDNEVVPITRTINGKALSSNISLTAADVGARPSNWVPSISDLGVTATAAELNKLDGVTATTAELNCVDGVTSNIQTQLNAKVPTTRTINGKALSSNISLTASDVGALPISGGTMNDYSRINIPDSSTGINTTMHESGLTVQGKSDGGWAAGVYFQNNSATSTLAFGGYGGSDDLSWIYIGKTYNDAAIYIGPDNNIILSPSSYGTTLPAAGTPGRIFFKKVSS